MEITIKLSPHEIKMIQELSSHMETSPGTILKLALNQLHMAVIPSAMEEHKKIVNDSLNAAKLGDYKNSEELKKSLTQ